MPLLRNDAFINNPRLRRYPTDANQWYDWLQELNRQTVASTSSNSDWVTDTTFSSTDADTVSWGSGALYTAAGDVYAIGAGNTGNMAALTYIYMDIATSVTAFQTSTTNTDAIGPGKLLIAVAENTSTEAVFTVFSGEGGQLITATNIAANSITANEIAGNTITANEIASTVTFTQTLILSTDGKLYTAGKTDYSDTTAGIYLGYDTSEADYVFNIGDASNSVQWDGSTLTVTGVVAGTITAGDLSGIVPLANENVAAQGWTYDGAFSATDLNTVAWATGTLTTAAGTGYSITGANTGNMAARTYIYLDIGVSTTALQTTTTATTAIGSGKVLVAVAENATDEAFFQVFGGIGGTLLSADSIAANAITANEIAANAVTATEIAASTITATEIATNAVTAAKINVTDLAAISADLGTITAGNITLDEFIASGQSAYDTGTGFWLEYNSGTPRFSLGNSAGNKMLWDGSTLAVNGTLTGSFPAASLGGTIDLDTQVANTLSTSFAEAGLINTNVTINADGSLTGAGAGQASLTSLPGSVQVGSIAANAVTAAEIAALAVTTAKLAAGAVEAGNINVSTLSAINANMGALTAGTIDLASGTSYIKSGQSAYDTGTGFWLEYNAGTPRFSIGNSAGNKVTWNGTTLSINGSIAGTIEASDLSGLVPLANEDVSAQGWQFDGTFSATDSNTVAWSSGTYTTSSGTTYSITGASTGNMTARTYIYLDSLVSTTAFDYTQTAANAVGPGKVIVAVAENSTDEAFFQVFGGSGGTLLTSNEIATNAITANEIAATTITADEIASNAVTAAKINVTDLAAVNASTGALTVSDTLTIGTSGRINSTNKTDYSDTDAGFYLGYDASEADWVFNIGDASNSMKWDGSTLVITGDISANRSADDWGATQTFTATWGNGFSTDPTGDMSYAVSMDGLRAKIWFPVDTMGTADTTAMSINNLPSGIRPAGGTATQALGRGLARSGNTDPTLCIADIAQASAGSAGQVHFEIFIGDTGSSGGGFEVDRNSWTSSGSKGLYQDNTFEYYL